jgi:hypothetical protein
MATNPDFKDLFSALSDAGAEFIVVGAHAVMFYTEPRYTKDIDVCRTASTSSPASKRWTSRGRGNDASPQRTEA